MSHTLRIILGCLMIILGIAGYLLPLPLGMFFLLLGMLLLSRDFPFFARILKRFKSRFPKAGKAAERCRDILTGER